MRTVAWFLLLFCLCVPSAFPEQNMDELEQKAKELILASNYEEARNVAERNLDLAKSTLDEHEPRLATAYKALGTVYFFQKKYPEADPFIRNALSIQDRCNVSTRERADTAGLLISILEKQGKAKEADKLNDSAETAFKEQERPKYEPKPHPQQSGLSPVHKFQPDPEPQIPQGANNGLASPSTPTIPQQISSFHAGGYKEVVRVAILRAYYDPYSLRSVSITEPFYGRSGLTVCIEANAKNRMGGYVGVKRTALIIKDEKVVKSFEDDPVCFKSDIKYHPWPEMEEGGQGK